jgi:hypothetical protein
MSGHPLIGAFPQGVRVRPRGEDVLELVDVKPVKQHVEPHDGLIRIRGRDKGAGVNKTTPVP